MILLFQIWKLLAGIAIFLLGMKFLEESLRHLAGRPFKLFLRKQTTSKIKAIFGGAIVTGILQSSSVVNLMVLAFVGTNVIQMQNALAVILGANLGTTLNSWIVAGIGFKFNIESIAFPIAGVSGIIFSLSNTESRWHHWSKFLFGFSFLFIGLGYMKTGMEEAVRHVDLSTFNSHSPLFFLLLGFLLTSLIQSSSATMAIVLSALNSNAINLFAATAIVLGSEAGTAVKLLLASVKGIPAKKRVALGNFLFNVVMILPVFAFLHPINGAIKNSIGIKNNLIALVFFQSIVNVLGILMFYPFLEMFGNFLKKQFTKKENDGLSINNVKVQDTELAIDALDHDVKNFILYTLDFAGKIFDLPGTESKDIPDHNHRKRNPEQQYELLKEMHGKLQRYGFDLQGTVTDKQTVSKASQLIDTIRNTMYAGKNLKDAMPDLLQLRNSSSDAKYNFYRRAAADMDAFCKRMISLLLHQENSFGELGKMYKDMTRNYSNTIEELYKKDFYNQLSEIEISTLINFNRELYTAYKSFVFAAKDYLLDSDQSAYFDELPGFIR